MRTQDPIVEELHAIREALAEASDNDLAKIVEAARARQQTSGHKVVELPSKRVDKAQGVLNDAGRMASLPPKAL